MKELFEKVGRKNGPIPVRGTINDAPYTQTVVRFRDDWRLYINGVMLKAAGLENGDMAHITIEYDPSSRVIPTHPELAKALSKSRVARSAYEKLAPYRRKEINRYLGFAKTDATRKKNIDTVIRHLKGEKTSGLNALLRIKR